jgi:hypothetical protein
MVISIGMRARAAYMNAVSGWALGRSRAPDPGILCPRSDRQRCASLTLGCGGCGSCAAPGGWSLKGGAGGLGSRPGGTGLSPGRAEHPDRPDGGPALRSAEVALGQLAADGALEPEVALVGWRIALTDDAFPRPLSSGSVASGPGVDCPGRASLASVVPGPGPRSRLSWTARLREEGER